VTTMGKPNFGGVSINRGADSRDLLQETPPEQWPDVVQAYRTYATRGLPSDCRFLLRMVSSGEAVGWAGYGSRAAFVQDGMGLDPEAVAWACRGIEIAGQEAPIAFRAAVALGRRGGDRRSQQARADQGTENTLIRGGNPKYLAARLRRDAPEIAARLGDFGSVHAAAKAAGIVWERTPLQRLLAIWKRASADERRAFLAEIGAA
jgi:hypothetical protein